MKIISKEPGLTLEQSLKEDMKRLTKAYIELEKGCTMLREEVVRLSKSIDKSKKRRAKAKREYED